ncbi:MAG TPA: NAD(P)H-hydrate dehydratase [Alphaproteobacteria bacterium]|nr:NAD(P)H-hydrate dehydratase [Alphaproteobacteria bacterium]
MARADAAAIAQGISGYALMEAAGGAVAAAIRERLEPRSTVVLCGPGNNGGDGFVVARHLREAGWPVRVALLGEPSKLKGDAAAHAKRWQGAVEPLAVGSLDGAALVVDALFGAGLDRPLTGTARAVIEALNAPGPPVVAVDVPSGLHGDTGEVLGSAPRAFLTVTFFRRKPGHLLLPGRLLCGETVVAPIGIPETVLGDAKVAPTFANHPDLWIRAIPWPTLLDHKYRRGHALIVGGEHMTGAARLAARGALRAGAGLVTVACPPAAATIYRLAMASLLVEVVTDIASFRETLESRRKSAYLLGPGNGATSATRERVLAALATGRPCVLDADALTAFAESPGALFDAIRGPCVMTPHEGEFARLFGRDGDKLSRAREAARQSGAVVLLKGGDSVIAAPDALAAINENAPAELGTAGAGDVLSGFVVALLARGMPAFEATAAATWLHGAAAAVVGPGVIAEDLPDHLPTVLRDLKLRLPSDPHFAAEIQEVQ